MAVEGISSFADCGSNFVSIRVPAEFLVDMIKSVEDSEYKSELLRKVEFSARRCKELKEILEKANLI